MRATGRTAHPSSADAVEVLRSPVLIGRAQLGDVHALDQLLRALQEPLFRHVHTIVADSHTAEDVLQEALLTISRKLRTLRDPHWFHA